MSIRCSNRTGHGKSFGPLKCLDKSFRVLLGALPWQGEGEDVAQQQQHHLDAASNVVDQEEGGDLALEA